MRILSVGLMIGDPENGFQKAMRKVATDGYKDMPCYLGSFNSDLINLATDFAPDLIFIQIQQEGVLTEETAARLAEIAFVVNFSGDVRDQIPSWYLSIGQYIHLSAFTNMVDVNKCLEHGVNSDYLEIGYDPTIFKKRKVPKTSPKIVAHFNHYENQFPLSQYRLDIVNTLQQRFPEEFGVYGNFPGSIGNFNDNQQAESENYNSALIGINCSHFDFERYSSDRMLRILGSGILCLSHNYDGIEEDYIIGKHLDVFNDLDELTDKCEYYLSNPKEAQKIANQGYLLARRKFTFDKMCKNLIKLYKTHSK